jgi:hypothetical protein
MGLLRKAKDLKVAYTDVTQAPDSGHAERLRFELYKPSELAVLSVRIPPSMKAQLSEFAAERGITLSDAVRFVLGDYLARNG